jgi:hypothetical protein
VADAATAPNRSQLPEFARVIASQEESKALEILQRQHPDYAIRRNNWQVLLDAYEATGGFLDGSYLWMYPRENSSSHEDRKKMARYHNYLEPLVDLYVRFIWTQGVKRNSKNQEYNDWTENIDGVGTTLDDLLKRALSIGLVHGHAGTLVDRLDIEPTGPAKVDDQAPAIANVFPAISIPDWRFDHHELVAVKLYEAGPQPGIAQELPEGEDAIQYLLWDLEGWARFDSDGQLIGGAMPNLGMVPLIVLRPKPSYISFMLGRPLVQSAKVLGALFNRSSEEDEVLRNQAFSVLAVSVPDDGDVAQVKKDLGNTIGTTDAIVAKGQIQYVTPDQAVAENIRNNHQYLVQELFRAAHIRFKRDSLAAESGESIRLQQSELNETLQGIAKQIEEHERKVARAWFAWMTPGEPEAAQAAYEAAQIETTYPSEFFQDNLITDLEAWAEAIRMNLGPTMNKRVKKAAVQRIDPNIPPDELEQINKEIEGMSDEELQNIPTMLLDKGDPEDPNGGVAPPAASDQGDGFA